MIDSSSGKGSELVSLPKLTRSEEGRFDLPGRADWTPLDTIKKRQDSVIETLFRVELDLAFREMRVYRFGR